MSELKNILKDVKETLSTAKEFHETIVNSRYKEKMENELDTELIEIDLKIKQINLELKKIPPTVDAKVIQLEKKIKQLDKLVVTLI